MDWNEIIDWFLKFAGVVDGMFFIAYSIGNLIEWIRNRRGR